MNTYLVLNSFISRIVKYEKNFYGMKIDKYLLLNKRAVQEILDYLNYGVESIFVKDLITGNYLNKKTKILGSCEEINPYRIQIELTDNCNLSCDYCYRNAKFNDLSSNYVDFGRIKNFLLKEKKRNLLEVGFTGGEATMHPSFIELILFCVKNFEVVQLISNGLNFRKILKVINFMTEEEKENFRIVLSLNSWVRVFDKFMKEKHYLNKALEILSKIFPLRINLTDIYLDEQKKEQIIKFLHEKYKIQKEEMIFSQALPFGKACGKIKIEDFKDLIQNQNDLKESKYNCGLCFDNVVMQPDGNLRLCTLNPFVVSDKPYDEIALNNKLFCMMPSPRMSICGDCKNLSFCIGCIFKGIANNFNNCIYRKKLEEDEDLKNLIQKVRNSKFD